MFIRTAFLLVALLAGAAGCNEPPPAPVDGGASFVSAVVERRLAGARRILGARGFRAQAPVNRGFLVEGDATAFEYRLRADACYVLSIASVDSLGIRVRLFDAQGQTIGATPRADTGNAVRGIAQSLCPTSTGPHYVSLKAVRGQGVVAAELFVGPRGAVIRTDDVFGGP